MDRVLDDHNGVIHYDPDRKDQPEECQHVDGETQGRHDRKRPNDRDGNCRSRDQCGTPVLQKHKNHDQYKDTRFRQSLVNLIDRFFYKRRRVEWNDRLNAFRKILLQNIHFRFDSLCNIQSICTRQLIHQQTGRRLPCNFAPLVISLCAKFHACHILDSRHSHPGTIVINCLDDDLTKLLWIGQPSLHCNIELKSLILRSRRLANLSGRHLHVLLANRGEHVFHCEITGLQRIRIHPDAHSIRAATNDLHIADAFNSRQRIFDSQRGEITQIQVVVSRIT